MKAYSVDLRQRVADAVLQDRLPWAEVARLFRRDIVKICVRSEGASFDFCC